MPCLDRMHALMNASSRIVITYGTFDLFHVGHVRLLTRLAALGDQLIVGVSTDEFNAEKGKHAFIPYDHRAEIVGSLAAVDRVVPESSWDQKARDIVDLHVSVLGMGNDWTGKFDHLSELCEVAYLPRTEGVSSGQLRAALFPVSSDDLLKVGRAIDALAAITNSYR